MKLNFQGRINNIVLPYCRSLLPLFEAIINSFHALEDSSRSDGCIKISIHRDKNQPRQPSLIGEGLTSRRILGFSIEDNGVGFNDTNFESFITSDTDHKRNRGAKGVGRFMWLKAFESVSISSIFAAGGKFKIRTFDFTLSGDGVSNLNLSESAETDPKTIIRLNCFQEKYEQECPRKADTIAQRIIEHCLANFMSPSCAKVILQDDDEKEPTNLNALYRKEIETQTKHATVRCCGMDFSINHVRSFAGEFSQHAIHLCANGRDVQHITLKNYIRYIPGKFKAANGAFFVYKAYVAGPFLDKKVNAERTAFHLDREGDLQTQGEPTEDVLIRSIVQAAEIELGPFLAGVEDRIKNRIETLIKAKYPEYRPLLKEIDAYLHEFPEDYSESDVLTKLNEIQFREDLKAREEVKKLLGEKDENVRNSQKYQTLQTTYLQKAHEIAQTRLAQCVIHRRIILDLLEAQIRLDENRKYPKEDRVHEIVFPMRKTSGEVSFDRQNLWIIDERLAYHQFLASDKPIQSFSSNKGAGDEPDLFILNYPGVFAAANASPVNSAVIVEFKRAERDNFKDKESPIQQVLRYVKKLRGQQIKDDNGRTITVHTEAVFYCYIIADLTDSLRTAAEESALDPTADELGYFGFNRNFKAYIEIISYDKLLKDSSERNRELFKALGLVP